MCFCFFFASERVRWCHEFHFILSRILFISFEIGAIRRVYKFMFGIFFGGHVSSLSGGVPTNSRSARRQISQKPLAAYQPAYLLVCAVYDHVVINSTNFFPRSESQWISMNVNLFCLHIQRNTQKDIHINYSTIHHSMSGATIFRWT